MAKADAKEVKDNINDLPLLRKEFERGQMQTRKLTALKAKLIELYMGEKQSANEFELMLMILKRDRLKGQLNDAHMELLNGIDIKKCEETCFVKVDNAPRVHHLSKDQVCRFYKDNDTDRFVVFVEIKVPPSHQMTYDLLMKEARGHFPSEDMYPKERIRLHRLDLTAKEFHAWFQINSDDILAAEKPEEYTF